MKFSVYLSLLLVLLGLISCEKLDFFDKDGACFDLAYPLTYNMPDGTSITANDESSLDASLKTWYTANPNSKAKPSLQFPVNAVFAEGTNKTIANETELKKAYAACDKKDDKCDIEFVYPLSLLTPDGTTLTFVDEQDKKTQLDNWYAANPNATTKPTLQYPIDIVFDDGSTQNIADEAALKAAYVDCGDDD